MSLKETPNYTGLRSEMQALIRTAVSDACDFMNDTAGDPGVDYKMSDVAGYAKDTLVLIIDPDISEVALCKTVTKAIDEYVALYIGFGVL